MRGDIRDILPDDERILIAAWMLPGDGALTDTQRGRAMENFDRYVRRRFLTYVDVAHQLGGKILAPT